MNNCICYFVNIAENTTLTRQFNCDRAISTFNTHYFTGIDPLNVTDNKKLRQRLYNANVTHNYRPTSLMQLSVQLLPCCSAHILLLLLYCIAIFYILHCIVILHQLSVDYPGTCQCRPCLDVLAVSDRLVHFIICILLFPVVLCRRIN